jgi:hypothetical protein
MTTIVAGGSDPSVEVSGSMASGVDGYLYGTADYDYHLSLSTLSTTIGDDLARESRSGPDEIISPALCA